MHPNKPNEQESAIVEKPSNQQKTATVARPSTEQKKAAIAKSIDPQQEFNDLCAANLQRPRDVEDKSAAARKSSKSMFSYNLLRKYIS